MEQGKFLTAFSDFEGAPRDWNLIEDENEKNQISIVNPKYRFDEEYRKNCVNCVIAYELRQRGFDVVAKSRKECNVSAKAESLWYDIDKHEAKSFSEVIEAIDMSEDARYFLAYSYPGCNGHAIALCVNGGVLYSIDPQIGSMSVIKKIKSEVKAQFVYWRIDNREVTQTGYNACKGRDSV